ncbi:5,10-methylenetetrahydrofolate reductase [Stenotrophomonas terrae]|uniref:Methylenetetrahydrofolate reductase n=1 Tax=Stenotrophomonas terrae TaxID=405446 RepID=A0A0R0D2D3_9GAMM|nr:5,10-methylenetetrahydrofolate reductase [Stenotrophomonas terrae]
MPSLSSSLTDAYSLEVSTKAIPALIAAAPRIAAGTSIFIPYLAGENDAARLRAAATVRGLGFEPMPHVPARRITSLEAVESFVTRAASEAGVERCFVIAGDSPSPKGRFADSASLIETGVFERAGIKHIGVGGHPEGHPVMSVAARWQVLARKCDSIESCGMSPLIVTQFGFDADVVLSWLEELRQRGIQHPVRVGVPGPASVAALARYAAMCGVSASESVWSKYGVSIGKLLGAAGPDKFVDRLASGLTEAHGEVSLHFFPFGGIVQTLEWMELYRARGHSRHA